jgi:hypothetical protein
LALLPLTVAVRPLGLLGGLVSVLTVAVASLEAGPVLPAASSALTL